MAVFVSRFRIDGYRSPAPAPAPSPSAGRTSTPASSSPKTSVSQTRVATPPAPAPKPATVAKPVTPAPTPSRSVSSALTGGVTSAKVSLPVNIQTVAPATQPKEIYKPVTVSSAAPAKVSLPAPSTTPVKVASPAPSATLVKPSSPAPAAASSQPLPSSYKPAPLPGPGTTRLPTEAEVKVLQRTLGVNESGYGPQTQAAVSALQKANGIPVDVQTMIGPKTWSHVMNIAEGFESPPKVAAAGSVQGATTSTAPITSLALINRMDSVESASRVGTQPAASSGPKAPLPNDYMVIHRDDTFPRRLSDNSVHNGIDMEAPRNTPIYAVNDGKVTKAYNGCGSDGSLTDTCGGNYGNHVIIDHPDGTQLRYAHMEPDTIQVKPGQDVKAGDRIGSVGTTGKSTGPHLHLEYYTDKGELADPRQRIDGLYKDMTEE